MSAASAAGVACCGCRAYRRRTPSARTLERKRLAKERTGHINRIKALLALHGITGYEPIEADRRPCLHAMVTHDGLPLPPRLRRELSRELDRLELVLEQLAEVRPSGTRSPPTRVPTTGRYDGPAAAARASDYSGAESVLPGFSNRKAVANYAGLTPSPYMSGTLQRDEGISKAGNRLVRTAMIELAWLWLRHQPFAAAALARKLLVAMALRHHRPRPDRSRHEVGLNQETPSRVPLAPTGG